MQYLTVIGNPAMRSVDDIFFTNMEEGYVYKNRIVGHKAKSIEIHSRIMTV